LVPVLHLLLIYLLDLVQLLPLVVLKLVLFVGILLLGVGEDVVGK